MTITIWPTRAPQESTAPAAFDKPDTGAVTAIRIPALAWIAVAVVLMWITFAFVGQNVAPVAWEHLHEFFHDGRHFLGIPCH